MAKDKRTKTAGAPAAAKANAGSPPAWPAFRPALPVADLAVEAVIPEQVVVVRTFFPRSLCREYVGFLRELPLTTTPGRPRRGEAVRVNDRFQVDDAAFAARLWAETGLREALLGSGTAHLWLVLPLPPPSHFTFLSLVGGEKKEKKR